VLDSYPQSNAQLFSLEKLAATQLGLGVAIFQQPLRISTVLLLSAMACGFTEDEPTVLA
jgi:hypothetical protein